MCARYYIEPKDSHLKELQSLADIRQREKSVSEKIKTSGEVFPTDLVYVMVAPGQYQAMSWGFSSFSKRPIINARYETLNEKPLFKEHATAHRCLAPASGFYEWAKTDKQKIKYRIFLAEHSLFLAGCYRQEANSSFCHFVIITKDADENIAFIHDRMPLIIPGALTEEWLKGEPLDLFYQGPLLEYQIV